MSAQGLSVALPLRVDARDGAYGLNKNLLQVANQNLKMVILTSPGERIMFPEFGVGARRYLFEQSTSDTIGRLQQEIKRQISKYLPYIKINVLSVDHPQDPFSSVSNSDKTTLMININYSVPAAGVTSNLTIPVSS